MVCRLFINHMQINKLTTLTILGLGLLGARASTNEVAETPASTNLFLGFVNPEKIVITYENELRAKDQNNNTPLFYDHNDIQFKYLLAEHFDIWVDYRLILQNKGTGFKDQSMILPGFNLKNPEQWWGKINLRVREEIGFNSLPGLGAKTTENQRNTWQLNLFPKYDAPWKWTKFKFQPFVADESFWDTADAMAFVRNRVYAGFDWEITPKIKGGTWYYRETQNSLYGSTHSDVGVMQIRFEF